MKTMAIIFLLILGTVSSGSEILTPMEFTEQFVAKLEKIFDVRAKILEELELKIILNDSNSWDMSLYNGYTDYARDPGNIIILMNNYLYSFQEIYGVKPKLTKDMIVPTIRHVKYLDLALQVISAKDEYPDSARVVFEKLNDELVIMFAFDLEFSIMMMDERRLKKLNINKDSLRNISIMNFVSKLPPIEIYDLDGIQMIIAGGDYESSLILVDVIWDGKALPSRDNAVFAIPSRDLLYVAEKNKEDEIRKLRKIVDEQPDSLSYFISEKLFYFDGDKIKIYKYSVSSE